MSDGYCSECGKACKEIKRDFGIGQYEYWGATGSHHVWHWVSECCDGDVLLKPPKEEHESEVGN